jgi:hypothetical protein
LRLVSSGTSRRRPNIVFTTPVSRAVASRSSMKARTDGKPAKYASMNCLRRLLRDADVLGERERRLPVEQRVVDDLRAAAQLVGVEPAVVAEDLQRRAVVDVLAAAERVDERLVAREVREHAQLDLRVVGRDQHVARVGDERAADLAAERGPDGDVLEVRVAAAQAPVAATAWLKQVCTRPVSGCTSCGSASM